MAEAISQLASGPTRIDFPPSARLVSLLAGDHSEFAVWEERNARVAAEGEPG